MAKAKAPISARAAAIEILTAKGEPMKLGDLVTETLKRAKGLKTKNAGDIVRVQVIRSHLDGGPIERVSKGTYGLRASNGTAPKAAKPKAAA